MGVDGLFRVFSDCFVTIPLRRLNGKVIGIDSANFFYDLKRRFALDLARGVLDRFVAAGRKKITDLMRRTGASKIVLVFDSLFSVPLKSFERELRARSRDPFREIGKSILTIMRNDLSNNSKQEQEDARPPLDPKEKASAQRKLEVLAQEMLKAAPVGGSSTARFIDSLLSNPIAHVEVMVAPLEAEMQLAYLAQIAIVDFVVSGDSDNIWLRTPFTVTEWAFPNAKVLDITKIPWPPAFTGVYSPLFVLACVLHATDYTPTFETVTTSRLKRIATIIEQAGLLLRQNGNSNNNDAAPAPKTRSDTIVQLLNRALDAIQKDPQLKVPDVLCGRVLRAAAAMMHHFVFDPKSQKVTPVVPLPKKNSDDDDNNDEPAAAMMMPVPRSMQKKEDDGDTTVSYYCDAERDSADVWAAALRAAYGPRLAADDGFNDENDDDEQERLLSKQLETLKVENRKMKKSVNNNDDDEEEEEAEDEQVGFFWAKSFDSVVDSDFEASPTVAPTVATVKNNVDDDDDDDEEEEGEEEEEEEEDTDDDEEEEEKEEVPLTNSDIRRLMAKPPPSNRPLLHSILGRPLPPEIAAPWCAGKLFSPLSAYQYVYSLQHPEGPELDDNELFDLLVNHEAELQEAKKNAPPFDLVDNSNYSACEIAPNVESFAKFLESNNNNNTQQQRQQQQQQPVEDGDGSSSEAACFLEKAVVGAMRNSIPSKNDGETFPGWVCPLCLGGASTSEQTAIDHLSTKRHLGLGVLVSWEIFFQRQRQPALALAAIDLFTRPVMQKEKSRLSKMSRNNNNNQQQQKGNSNRRSNNQQQRRGGKNNRRAITAFPPENSPGPFALVFSDVNPGRAVLRQLLGATFPSAVDMYIFSSTNRQGAVRMTAVVVFASRAELISEFDRATTTTTIAAAAATGGEEHKSLLPHEFFSRAAPDVDNIAATFQDAKAKILQQGGAVSGTEAFLSHVPTSLDSKALAMIFPHAVSLNMKHPPRSQQQQQQQQQHAFAFIDFGNTCDLAAALVTTDFSTKSYKGSRPRYPGETRVPMLRLRTMGRRR